MTTAPAPATQWEGQPVTAWTGRLGVPSLVICDVVSSTSDVIRQLAADGAPAGAVCIADRQTAGRGQHGRRWNDAPGLSLLFSILFRPAPADPARLAPGALPVRVGIAAALALRQVAAVDAWLKWPNDVVVPGHGKIAGVLCEAVNAGTAGGYVVVGIGINVRQQTTDFPAGLRGAATSVALAGGSPNRAALMAALAGRLLPMAVAPLHELDPDEMEALQQLDMLRGRRVHAQDGSGTRSAVADGVLPDGALRLVEADATALLRTGTVRIDEPARSGTP